MRLGNRFEMVNGFETEISPKPAWRRAIEIPLTVWNDSYLPLTDAGLPVKCKITPFSMTQRRNKVALGFGKEIVSS